ncbi:MAG: STAS domain-containing protein [Caldilineae bacterium]|nr:MAG: STAS domain-containing protein [Caldilineae bacterium]
MKITIWGARGSIPSPILPHEVEEKICQAILQMPALDTRDEEAVRTYVRQLPQLERGTAGGNTTCVEVQANGQTILIDAGSGLRELGQTLMQGPCGRGEGVLHLLFSHAHWDHLLGFPFFAPAYVPGNRIIIYHWHDMKMALEDQQRPDASPRPFDRLQATLEFRPFEVGQPFTIGGVRINTIENVHPGKAFSFRFEDGNSIFVHASDAEYKKLDDASVQPFIEFFKDADALIFDAQYTLREAWQKIDWGHSSALIGVDLARAAGVKRLLLFHHDPTYSDAELQKIRADALAYQAQDPSRPYCDVLIAHEGLTLDLALPPADSLRVVPEKETAIVAPSSVFDEQSVSELARRLAHAAHTAEPSNSIIDLSQVKTLTTAGLKALTELRQKPESAQIVLACPSPQVRKVIQLSGYADFFAVYPSVQAARSAIQARRTLGLPGHLFRGRYLIERTIARNLLGTVLKATDTPLHRPVTLKILSPDFSRETVTYFLNQIQSIVKLNHPHIVRVFDVGTDGEYTFLVEEFVDSPTLADRLADTEHPLSADEALDIALDIALTLEYAHSRGIVHTNLRPQNIFLTPEGIKLSSFGFGRLEKGRNLLEAPLLRWTAAYLAPEQILGQSLDARTDLYTLGVILYQIFTGRLPFEGNDREVMEAHLHQQPVPPRHYKPHLSRSLEHLILKLLAKNPNERYASARQARRISSGLVVSVGETVHPPRRQLVGRQAEMKALLKCWQEVRQGHGQIAFLTGEPGIGKTSLAQQFAAQSNAPVLLFGRCTHTPGQQAYRPFVEALETYFATVPPELFDADARRLIAGFASLIPQVEKILPNLLPPPPLEPEQAQHRLVSNLIRFLKRAAQHRPWLLVLDDLQWADAPTLQLLRHLGHHLPGIPLLLVGIYQDTALTRGHPLQAVLRDLHRHPGYHLIALNRLDRPETERLLASLWGHEVPSPIADRIFRHTGGNPFFVQEIANNLLDEGHITIKNGKWIAPQPEEIPLPPGIREVVLQRIHQLRPDTQALLRQAAVLGTTFRFDDLCRMSGLPETEVLEHLDIALERKLIVESTGEVTLRFNQAEVQTILYDEIGPLRQRILHRQAGEAMEKRAMPEPERLSSELAYHFYKAGAWEKALHYTCHAAEQARAACDNQTARMGYTRALHLLDRLAETHPETYPRYNPLRLTVHRALGELLALQGEYEQAETHYQTAIGLLQYQTPTVEQAFQVADLCRRMAEIHIQRRHYEAALEWLSGGLRCLQAGEPSPAAARLHLVGARLYARQEQYDTAMQWCRQALSLASQLPSEEARRITAHAYYLLGDIYFRQEKFRQGIDSCQQSVAMYRQTGDLPGLLKAYRKLADAHYKLDEWAQAEEACQHGLKLAHDIGDVHSQGTITDKLALLHFNRGEWPEALTLLEQSLAIWQRLGIAEKEANTLSKLAQVNLAQRNWSQARNCLARAEALSKETGRPENLSELERCQSELALQTGALDEALSHIRRAIERAVQTNNPLEEGISQRVLGQICHRQGEFVRARTALQKSLALLETLPGKFQMAYTHLVLAELDLATGHKKSARLHLQAAAPVFESLRVQPALKQVQTLQNRLN